MRGSPVFPFLVAPKIIHTTFETSIVKDKMPVFNLMGSEFKIFFKIFFIFRATLVAFGSSQARDQIRTAAAGLHHSHSNLGSKPCL